MCCADATVAGWLRPWRKALFPCVYKGLACPPRDCCENSLVCDSLGAQEISGVCDERERLGFDLAAEGCVERRSSIALLRRPQPAAADPACHLLQPAQGARLVLLTH